MKHTSRKRYRKPTSYARKRRYANGSRNRRRPKRLDMSLFVKKAAGDTHFDRAIEHAQFSDFEIPPQLQAAIRNIGYTSPTQIQDQCIPHLLSGRDVLGVAHTGSGKTAAFLIPLVNKVLKDKSAKVLIITPVRELALQIENELGKFTKGMDIHSLACIGGTRIRAQIRRLKRRPHFVIATPGRLLDLEKKRAIRFADYSSIVLDEVDRMLDMGFIKDIAHIIKQLPSDRQSLFFSATLPKKMDSLIQSFLHDHITVKININTPSKNVDQDIIRFSQDNKLTLLEDVLSREAVSKTLIFGRTKRGIKKLARQLSQKGFKVAQIHGNKSQSQRQKALKKFRQHEVHILVATDVAARGLDVKDITHVINYDAPESYDDYIHRIGRTGRAGSKGTALTFVKS